MAIVVGSIPTVASTKMYALTKLLWMRASTKMKRNEARMTVLLQIIMFFPAPLYCLFEGKFLGPLDKMKKCSVWCLPTCPHVFFAGNQMVQKYIRMCFVLQIMSKRFEIDRCRDGCDQDASEERAVEVCFIYLARVYNIFIYHFILIKLFSQWLWHFH